MHSTTDDLLCFWVVLHFSCCFLVFSLDWMSYFIKHWAWGRNIFAIYRASGCKRKFCIKKILHEVIFFCYNYRRWPNSESSIWQLQLLVEFCSSIWKKKEEPTFLFCNVLWWFLKSAFIIFIFEIAFYQLIGIYPLVKRRFGYHVIIF